MATANSGIMDLRINYNVNLLHFIDHLSQWSQYTGDDAKNMYLKYFDITDQDQKMLDKYSSIRNKLGWEAEIDLFNWAYKSFSIDNSDSVKNTLKNVQDLTELKIIIEYFSKRKSDKATLNSILKEKFSELSDMSTNIINYASNVEKDIENIKPYINIWVDEVDFSKYPVYVCFSHCENSTHGGANGPGIYSEFDTTKKEKSIGNGFNIITHELLHKVTSIENNLIEFIKSEDNYVKSAQDFMRKNNLYKNKLLQVFESTDPEGLGNPESKVFEEVNIYLFAPVMINSMDSLKVNRIYEQNKSKGIKEYTRIWYGVRLFKKEFESINQSSFNKNEFIWRLIELYYEKIYFDSYCNSSP
ncbi:MAG: hypothetical protein JXN63_02140 [Candidatus Delongbacteria bacterium]|nr:hypothetical protein [Candidatus Delongbacteria bacterium]